MVGLVESKRETNEKGISSSISPSCFMHWIVEAYNFFYIEFFLLQFYHDILLELYKSILISVHISDHIVIHITSLCILI
jgi:hypothetical protein